MHFFKELNKKEFTINGVGGWVLVFSLTSLITLPLLVLRGIISSDIDSQYLFSSYPNLPILIIVETIFSISLAVFGIYAALLLLMVKKNAISMAKAYLIAISLHKVVSIFLVYLTGLMDSSMALDALVEIFSAIAYSLIWYIYFSKSKKVQAIY